MSKLGRFAAACAAVVVGFGVCGAAFGADKAWTGAVDSAWETDGNWDPAGVPGTDDAVTIESGTVKVKDKLSVGSLAIGANATVFFGSTGTSVTEAYMDYPEADTTRVFRVAGDLSVAGKLALGGRGRAKDLKDYVEISNLVVSVGGNLTLSGAARVKVYAAPMPRDLVYNLKSTSKYQETFNNIWQSATVVQVGGTLTVGGTAILYPENDPMTGTPVVFKAAFCTVAEGAKVSADGLGWTWCDYTTAVPADSRYTQARMAFQNASNKKTVFTLATGNESTETKFGGKTSSYGGSDRGYGSAYAPFLSGTPGDIYNQITRGGGTVCLWVTGDLAVNGTVSALGSESGTGVWSVPASGSIWLMAHTATFGDNSKLTVEGRPANAGYGTYYGGCGGRISLGVGLSASEVEALVAGSTPADLGLSSYETIAAPSVNVSGGANTKVPSRPGQNGTMTTVFGSLSDVTVKVLCTPVELDGIEPACGSHALARNSTQHFSAPEFGPNPAAPDDIAYGCLGYVVSNLTSEVTRGDTTSFDLKLEDDSLFVTWLYGDTYYKLEVAESAHATVKVDGADAAASYSDWVLSGDQKTIEIVPEEGYEFYCWEGDLDAGETVRNPLVVSVVRARRVRAVMRPVTEPTTVTWLGGEGDWTDGEQWDTGYLPGPADDVVIPSGTCSAKLVRAASLTLEGGSLLVKEALSVGSLEVAADATLFFGSTGKSVTEAYMAYPDVSVQRAFTVAGDLHVAGKLALGGRGRFKDIADYVEIEKLLVSVGGDFTLSGAARVKVYAAPMPRNLSYNLKSTSKYQETFNNIWQSATVVQVGGALTVGDTAILYPENDPMTGTPVVFKAASCTVADGAKVSADALGWTWCEYTTAVPADSRNTQAHVANNSVTPKRYYFTLATGNGSTQTDWNTATSSYGGSDRGYGSAYAPFLSGAPGDAYQGITRAGGTVCLWVTGDLTVNGTVSAQGQAWTSWGAPTSGSIWLLARKTVIGDSAKVTARGIDNQAAQGAGGCGGRVSLGIGLSEEEVEALATGSTPDDLGLAYDDAVASSAVDVHGGKKSSTTYGQNGTATTVYGSLGDVSLTVLSTPVAALGVEPAYGSYTFERNTTETFTAPARGADPVEPDGIAYTCDGYVVSNATEEVASGPETSFSLKLTDSPLYVTWKWTAKSQGVVLTLDGNVTATVNGETLTDSGTVFLAEGATATVEALPADGYEFLFWEGEVEYGKLKQNPLVYTANVARRLKPVVRRIAEPTTATWKGGTGSWSDAAMWDTDNVPGLGDDVVIASGVCTAANWIQAKSLTLGGKSTKLQIAYTASDRLGEAGGEIAGDLAISGSARLDVAQRNRTRHGNLTVGGDLTLAGSAVLAIAAGPADGERFTMVKGGGVLSVGGTFAMKDTSTLIPNCEPYTGLGVVVTADRFTLDAQAKVDAIGLGWACIEGLKPDTLAPGKSWAYTVGSGYGGRGNDNDNPGKGGATYGNSLAPIHPGSPKCYYSDGSSYNPNGDTPGGGSIRIHAARVVLNGKLDATGGTPGTLGAPSGGGIWVTASAKLKVGPTAQLIAKGKTASSYGGHGGGGRIALGVRLTDEQVAALAAGEPDVLPGNCAKVTVYEGTNTQFAVDFPGATACVDAGAKYPNGEGTVRYLKGLEPGLMLIVR